jgi:hypothetical protein
MNERIKELIEKSGVYIAYENKEVTDKELEFLVELVVRECIDQAVKEEERYDSMADPHIAYCSATMANFQGVLEKHFGVEEHVKHKGWVCPKCGTDRTREVCPKGYSAVLNGGCPMVGTAQ